MSKLIIYNISFYFCNLYAKRIFFFYLFTIRWNKNYYVFLYLKIIKIKLRFFDNYFSYISTTCWIIRLKIYRKCLLIDYTNFDVEKCFFFFYLQSVNLKIKWKSKIYNTINCNFTHNFMTTTFPVFRYWQK